ncbi:MAG TPA: hypothetical protein PLJ21_07200, partial [Pseudobdellovibrionaceae bacterium]|nr:hypothetical protein [Pseudobdellovibrionaceae bacterium]
RPFKLSIKDPTLQDLNFSIQNQKCENFLCDFTVVVDKIKFNSEIDMKYLDGGYETAIPRGALRIESGESQNIELHLQVGVNPGAKNLNDSFQAISNIKMDQPNGPFLYAAYDPIPPSTTPQSQRGTGNNPFENKYIEIQNKFRDSNWIKERVSKEIHAKNSEIKKTVQERLKSQHPECTNTETQNSNEKLNKCLKIEEEISKKVKENDPKYTSLSQLYFNETEKPTKIEVLSKIQWPNFQNDDNFKANFPGEIQPFIHITREEILEEFQAKKLALSTKNINAFNQALSAANQTLSHSILVDEYIKPYIENELGSRVSQGINDILATTQEKWDMISKIPRLNAQLLSEISQKESQIDSLKNEMARKDAFKNNVFFDNTDLHDPLINIEKLKKLENELADLKKRLSNEFIEHKTTVLVDQIDNMNKTMTLGLYPQGAKCPPHQKMSPQSKAPYDMETTLGLSTVDHYMKLMIEQKQLNFCHGQSKDHCLPVEMNEKPKISCQNGQFVFDFNKVKVSDSRIKIKKEVLVELKNCNGAPCFQFKGGQGQFDSKLLNLFLNSFLNDSINAGLKKADHQALPIPKVKLKDLRIDPKSCQTNLQWDFERSSK